MAWIENFLNQGWALLETLGWWLLMGLVLGWLVRFLPLEKVKKGKIPAFALLGALLPMCNFAAIPIAAALLTGGAGTGSALAFLAGATLLNPAGLLLGWAYLGPKLTVAYGCGSLAAACLTGFAAESQCADIPQMDDSKLTQKLLLWGMAGILAQTILLSLAPSSLWRDLVGNPTGASLGTAVAAGLFRHVCIPDDIALTASLVASGLRPGWGIGLLLIGAATNLPELLILYGIAGRKTAGTYLLTMVGVGLITAVLTQLILGNGFVPHFNLADAEVFARLANLVSIRTWMPAKIPCAIGLLIFFGWALWRERKQFGFDL